MGTVRVGGNGATPTLTVACVHSLFGALPRLLRLGAPAGFVGLGLTPRNFLLSRGVLMLGTTFTLCGIASIRRPDRADRVMDGVQ